MWREQLLDRLRQPRRASQVGIAMSPTDTTRVAPNAVLNVERGRASSSGSTKDLPLLRKLGPFKLISVDSTPAESKGATSGRGQMDLKVGPDGWSIDQRSPLLQSATLREDSGGGGGDQLVDKVSTGNKYPLSRQSTGLSEVSRSGSAAASSGPPSPQRRTSGRLSNVTPVSLNAGALKEAGIHEDAYAFAFAYPLSHFTSGHALAKQQSTLGELSHDEALLTDLELDLHAALDRFDAETRGDWPYDESQQRDNALRFLATGGYIYFDKDYTVIQVTTLLPKPADELGLDFGTPCQWRSDQESQDGTDDFDLRQLCHLLLRRGSFHPPTLPALLRSGVTGFCWLLPGEVLPGFNSTKTIFKEYLTEGKNRPRPDKRSNSKLTAAEMEDQEMTRWLRKLDANWTPFPDLEETKEQLISHVTGYERKKNIEQSEKTEKDIAKTLWPDGAFIYMVGNPSEFAQSAQKKRRQGEAKCEAYLFPVRDPALGLAWRQDDDFDGNAVDHPKLSEALAAKRRQAIGSKWKAVGRTKPRGGTEIVHAALSSAMSKKLESTKEGIEQLKLDIKVDQLRVKPDIKVDSFIKVCDEYFEQAGDKEPLEFDKPEFNDLQVHNLRPDSYIKVAFEGKVYKYCPVDPNRSSGLKASAEKFLLLKRHYKARKVVAKYAKLYITMKRRARQYRSRKNLLPESPESQRNLLAAPSAPAQNEPSKGP